MPRQIARIGAWLASRDFRHTDSASPFPRLCEAL